MKHTDPASPKASARPAHEPAGRHHYTAEELHNVDVAHEHSDINIRAIIASTLALTVITVGVAGLMYGAFRLLDYQARRADPQLSPLSTPSVEMPASTADSPAFGNAPRPQLLTNEYAVLARQRQAEEQQLTKYGWVDAATGVARIPIEEAKKLLLERGLPARPDGSGDPTLGTNRPARGESSSGRAVDGPPRGAGLPQITAPAAPATHEQKGGH